MKASTNGSANAKRQSNKQQTNTKIIKASPIIAIQQIDKYWNDI